MFTGIVEEKGVLRRRIAGGQWGSLEIAARQTLAGTRVGDSVAVNGVCLTVRALSPGGFTADVMAETLRRTNLGLLAPGEEVNLERAMALGGRFGGHIVSGHIDGQGRVLSARREGNAVWLRISAPPPILALIVPKGSVAIDGVSLTVAKLEEGAGEFQVSLIPHTARETTLLAKKTGQIVNLENDIVGKYVARLLGGGGLPGQISPADFAGAGLTGADSTGADSTTAGAASKSPLPFSPLASAAAPVLAAAPVPDSLAGGAGSVQGLTLDFLRRNGFS